MRRMALKGSCHFLFYLCTVWFLPLKCTLFLLFLRWYENAITHNGWISTNCRCQFPPLSQIKKEGGGSNAICPSRLRNVDFHTCLQISLICRNQGTLPCWITSKGLLMIANRNLCDDIHNSNETWTCTFAVSFMWQNKLVIRGRTGHLC